MYTVILAMALATMQLMAHTIGMLIAFIIPFDPTALFEWIGQLFPSLQPFLTSGHGWATTGTLTAFIIVVSELVDKWWHLDGWQAAIRCAVIGALFALVGYIFSFGMFSADSVNIVLNGAYLPQWLQAMIVGVYATLVAYVSWAANIGPMLLALLHIRPLDNAPAKSLQSATAKKPGT